MLIARVMGTAVSSTQAQGAARYKIIDCLSGQCGWRSVCGDPFLAVDLVGRPVRGELVIVSQRQFGPRGHRL